MISPSGAFFSLAVRNELAPALATNGQCKHIYTGGSAMKTISVDV